MEVAPRSKFSQHFGTYMQIYEERKKVGVLIDSYGVEKHISVLKSK